MAAAAPFSFTSSKTHQAPQVTRAHTEPVTNPNIPNKKPTLAKAAALISWSIFDLLRYIMLYTMDVNINTIIANHIGTWKYRFRMDCSKIFNSGIVPENPIITV